MWKVGEVCRYCRESNTSSWGVGVIVDIQLDPLGAGTIYHVMGDDGLLAEHRFIMRLVTR